MRPDYILQLQIKLPRTTTNHLPGKTIIAEWLFSISAGLHIRNRYVSEGHLLSRTSYSVSYGHKWVKQELRLVNILLFGLKFMSY